MPDLSPAAASIVQAFDDRYELLGGLEENWQEDCLAAALRAVADQVKHEFPLCSPVTEWDSGHDAGIRRALNKFLALAAELDKTSQQS
jgi:hypothetical protein